MFAWSSELLKNKVWQRISHRIPNVDLIQEIDGLWQSSKYKMLKVKSHVPFEQATNHDELWKFVGNHCADLAATSVLNSIPDDMKQLIDSIACHVRSEGKSFKDYLDYLVQFNRCRLQKLNELKQDKGTSLTQFQHARARPATITWNFRLQLDGH